MPKKLAVEGGKPALLHPIKRLNTVTDEQVVAVHSFMMACREGKAELSGYLAGSKSGGSAVQRLESAWQDEFGVTHAIACNSCTSALHAIILALDSGMGSIHLPVLGMSAIAATTALTAQSRIKFVDVDEHYCVNIPDGLAPGDIVVAVNLFGHPAKLTDLSLACRNAGAILIEDNAQAPWATEEGVYTGTFNMAAAWSFNVHKPINAGEGGMITTDNDGLARRVREIVNHGEASGGNIGFNWRMPELTAVIVMAQMKSAKEVVRSRQRLADALAAADAHQDGLEIAKERPGCRSAWYCLPMLATDSLARSWAAKALRAEGVPVSEGYVVLPRLEAFKGLSGRGMPLIMSGVAASDRMLLLELCSIDPTPEQVEQMIEAITSVGERLAG